MSEEKDKDQDKSTEEVPNIEVEFILDHAVDKLSNQEKDKK